LVTDGLGKINGFGVGFGICNDTKLEYPFHTLDYYYSWFLFN